MVEDFGDLHLRAWEALAAEEGKPVPPRWMLRRAEGMKNEQARSAPARRPALTLTLTQPLGLTPPHLGLSIPTL